MSRLKPHAPSAVETAWSVLEEVLRDNAALFRTTRTERVWVAQPDPSPSVFAVLQRLQPAKIEIMQTFRPAVDELEIDGFFATQAPANGPFEIAVCVPTRQRTESLALMAHGLLNLSGKGRFVFACANTQGAPGYLKHLKEAFPALEAESSQKCRWVILEASQIENRKVLESWIEAAAPVQVPGSEFFSVPGIYGWNKIDRASQLLVASLPALAGKGADLGSGYGYLSHHVLSKHAQVTHLDLIEAEARALDCARKNLPQAGERASFHWLDATAPATRSKFQALDWVVMNPPFHEGADVNQGVGRAFIETAAAILKPEGHLYMVANVFLGYEKVLSQHFRKVERVCEEEGFKVIHAQR